VSKKPPMPQAPREAPLGDRARHAACRALARQARVFPEMDLGALDRALETEPELSDLDRAFAHAVYDATVRNWLLLRFLLARCTTQPFDELEPRVRGVLMAAAAQIILLDRVPVHAAINHAVEWAKRVIRPGAGGLVNAVLRKVSALRPPDESRRREKYSGARDELPTADGASITLTESCLPENENERLSIVTSHPTELLDHWLKQLPPERVRALAMHGICQAPIVLNTEHAKEPLPDTIAETHATPGHHVFTGSAADLRSLLTDRRDIWVQDAASAQGVRSVADLKPSVVLDLCAGQGTKTRQLAAAFPNAQIAATDIDEPRFAALSATFANSPQVIVQPLPKLRDQFLGKADLILLDVPCSNTGVLARRPEAKYRFCPATLNSLLSVQKQIIADCIPLLRESPRGRILYSTCSLEPEENQQQAAWVDRWHSMRKSREKQANPAGRPGDSAKMYTDGSYSALLG